MTYPPDALTTETLASYMTAAGWISHANARGVVWRPPAGPHEELQAVLPPPQSDDASQVLLEAAQVVAFVEGFTLNALLSSLTAEGADTLSVRLLPAASAGVAPLALAQESITALRMLLVGAGAALTNPSLVLPSRRPTLVENYAAEALVSTRPGSFIWDVTLPLNVESAKASPVPEGQDTLVDVKPLPLGRSLTNRMATVLANATATADLVTSGEAGISRFAREDLSLGNALELDALSNLGDVPDTAYQIRIAQSALAPRTQPTRLHRVTETHRARFREAAEYLRSTQPQSDLTVDGLVVKLARTGSMGPGDVTIRGLLDDSGKPKSCVVNLSEEDYASAHRAHLAGLVVVVKGDLMTSGSYKELKNPSQFYVIDNQ